MLNQAGLKDLYNMLWGTRNTETIRSHKTEMYNIIEKERYKGIDEWFLKYAPNSEKKTRKNK